MMTWNRSRTIAVGGIATALVLGGGGIALAQSQGDANTAVSASAAPSPAGRPHRGIRWERIASRIEHGQFVVRGKNGTVTRDLIHGDVVAVSSSAITVKAADGTQETYAVTPQTKVRVRSNGKGAPSSVSAISLGDQAVVLGTGTTALTANRVVDIKR